MALPRSALRQAGVLPPSLWLIVRRIGINRTIVLGYLLAAALPVVAALVLGADAGLDLWANLWWLIPSAALFFGAQFHWRIYVNWRHYDASKEPGELLERL